MTLPTGAPLPPREGPGMLESLRREHRPETNLKSQFARAGWIYLLPSLELERVLCIGVPDDATLTALAERAAWLAVACVPERDLRARTERNPRLAGIEWREDGAPWRAEIDQARIDLVVIADGAGRRWLTREARNGDLLRTIVERGAVVYVEGLAPRSNTWRSWRATLATAPRFFRLLPLWGDLRVAVPDSDSEMLHDLIRGGFSHPWQAAGLPGRVGKLIRRIPGTRLPGRRYGAVLGGEPTPPRAAGPPAYLRTLAARSGVSLDGYRWGFSLPGAYRSRKLLFHLRGNGPTKPDYMVKMVSDASLNERLERAARALTRLEAAGIADGVRAPRIAFSGHHAGIAIVAETRVPGAPFREASAGGPDCPHARAALAAIADLARADLRSPASGLEVARVMADLVDRFEQLYRDTERTLFLRRQVEIIAGHAAPIPLVFQHGDPGTWNLVVASAGSVGFLDWESADERGVPLWDLFSFLRSYGAWSTGHRGRRGFPLAFERTFFGESALARWARGAVAQHAATVGVPRTLIEPLFHLCWMHRSLKEAARLRATELDQGLYANLLRIFARDQGRVTFSFASATR